MTKSRTVWINVLIAILAMIELKFPLLQDMAGEWYGLAFIVVSGINIYLRTITTQPLSERKLVKK